MKPMQESNVFFYPFCLGACGGKVTRHKYYTFHVLSKILLGAYCAINFTWGFTIKHSEKKQSSHPKSVHVYPQSHQTYLQDAYTRHTVKQHNHWVYTVVGYFDSFQIDRQQYHCGLLKAIQRVSLNTDWREDNKNNALRHARTHTHWHTHTHTDTHGRTAANHLFLKHVTSWW